MKKIFKTTKNDNIVLKLKNQGNFFLSLFILFYFSIIRLWGENLNPKYLY